MRKVEKLETAISRDALRMTTKVTQDGKVFLFMKDGNGSYHAFTEVTTKGAMRVLGVKWKKNIPTRAVAKEYLGF